MQPAVWLAVLVLLAGTATLWLFSVYRGLSGLRLLVRRSWQQVDDELRRRHDLVPDVVALVREHARPLADAAERVRTAQQAARRPASGVGERVGAERDLSTALADLFEAADARSGLRSDESYLALRRELTDIGGRATAARRLYNANVDRLALRLESLPAAVVGRALGIGPAERAGSLSAVPRDDRAGEPERTERDLVSE